MIQARAINQSARKQWNNLSKKLKSFDSCLLVYTHATPGRLHCVGPHSLFPIKGTQYEKTNQPFYLFCRRQI